MAKRKFQDGPSQRQLRVGEMIRRTLADALAQGDVHDPDLNRMSVTVCEVVTSPDLKIATAYVMPLGGGNYTQAIDYLARNKGALRQLIGRKSNLKYTPDLRFRIDETFDRMDAARKLFDKDDVRRDLPG